MELPKDKIIALLARAARSAEGRPRQRRPPDEVDTDKHGDLLDKLGIDPGRCSGASATRSASGA